MAEGDPAEGRSAILKGVKDAPPAASLGLSCALTVLACGYSSPPAAPATPAPTPTPIPTVNESQTGTVPPHGVTCFQYTMADAGLVTATVTPVLFLTLRTGTCIQFGDFISNSDTGSLTVQVPAGTNLVFVSSPRDDPTPYSLTVVHPR